jgi:hypothetical protein
MPAFRDRVPAIGKVERLSRNKSDQCETVIPALGSHPCGSAHCPANAAQVLARFCATAALVTESFQTG